MGGGSPDGGSAPGAAASGAAASGVAASGIAEGSTPKSATESPAALDGAVADQDADLAGPGAAPDGEVERHRLESQPRGDLGGGGPVGVGGVGREDQCGAEAVGHGVAVLVKEEMSEIEQRGQVEGERGGGWLGGGGVEGEEGGQDSQDGQGPRG